MGIRRLWITYLFQYSLEIFMVLLEQMVREKTSTIKAVVGIHDFEDGSIIINGHSIKEEPVICKKNDGVYPR